MRDVDTREMKHASMKNTAVLVGVFSHSAVNNDALRLSQQSLNEKENKQLKEVQCDAEDMNEEPREEKLDDSGRTPTWRR